MCASTRRTATMKNPKRALRVVEARDVENVVNAPPVLVASSHTIPFSIRRHYNDNAVKTLTIGVSRYVVNVFEVGTISLAK
jgi:phage terminase Nu1 subunit (DNA packaging protein)